MSTYIEVTWRIKLIAPTVATTLAASLLKEGERCAVLCCMSKHIWHKQDVRLNKELKTSWQFSLIIRIQAASQERHLHTMVYRYCSIYELKTNHYFIQQYKKAFHWKHLICVSILKHRIIIMETRRQLNVGVSCCRLTGWCLSEQSIKSIPLLSRWWLYWKCCCWWSGEEWRKEKITFFSCACLWTFRKDQCVYYLPVCGQGLT